MFEPKNVIVEFLRARLTDPRGRSESTNTETFSGDGSETSFSLTAPEGKVRCIVEVKVDGVIQNKNEDYTIDLQNEKVIFSSAPNNGTNNISITYKYGTSCWIYPDQPRVDLTTRSYPRIGVTLISGVGNRMGNYEASVISSERYQIDIFAHENEVFNIDGVKYEGEALCMYLARKINLVFKDYIDDLYPLLSHYTLLNITDARWESEGQVFHTIMEIGLEGENLGE